MFDPFDILWELLKPTEEEDFSYFFLPFPPATAATAAAPAPATPPIPSLVDVCPAPSPCPASLARKVVMTTSGVHCPPQQTEMCLTPANPTVHILPVGGSADISR